MDDILQMIMSWWLIHRTSTALHSIPERLSSFFDILEKENNRPQHSRFHISIHQVIRVHPDIHETLQHLLD
jgi:hypothetical protein